MNGAIWISATGQKRCVDGLLLLGEEQTNPGSGNGRLVRVETGRNHLQSNTWRACTGNVLGSTSPSFLCNSKGACRLPKYPIRTAISIIKKY